ncbi:hypothetical protein QWZ13_14115 [Reinekea marina]|nr:hypothetical protein [Reinekea marina]MDN3650051.1 hypothetical protein [Reinekea marina]
MGIPENRIQKHIRKSNQTSDSNWSNIHIISRHPDMGSYKGSGKLK